MVTPIATATDAQARRRRARARPTAGKGHGELEHLRNLGPQSQRMLQSAGISLPQLRRLGALQAFCKVRAVAPTASLNLLYALVGALEDLDWRDVRRTRKLALLVALEDAQRALPARKTATKDSLLALRNIGPAMRRDLTLLGVRSAAHLARHEPDRLYQRLQKITGQRHDPCVWDTFAAAVHQARTGEALPWWHFTAQRKQRMAAGTFITPPLAQAQATQSTATSVERQKQQIKQPTPQSMKPRTKPHTKTHTRQHAARQTTPRIKPR
jgi:predicted flap endonuclease-1-like 5' DNA nuclease